MLLHTLNSSMGSFIGGFQDMETSIKYKIQFDICSFGNKGTKKYMVKNFILFVAYFKPKTSCI